MEPEAPNLIDFAKSDKGYETCFIKRQPQTLKEHFEIFAVMEVGELGCLRYSGSNNVIMQRLVEAGDSGCCDHLPNIEIKSGFRNIVLFSFQSFNKFSTLEKIALDFEIFCKSHSLLKNFSINENSLSTRHVSITVEWFWGEMKKIQLIRKSRDDIYMSFSLRKDQWFGRYDQGTGFIINSWLNSYIVSDMDRISWFTDNEWQKKNYEEKLARKSQT